ncbi:putative DOMON domain, cytochrome b561/ferric reductase transmembrane [Rosa chinensis]|uniref:Putative DOMON domain, cytochrome b561/ferric reductase transmembrane n=2 Tax=Rosa chinensis TaxID=74649 RepID=A0A2P6P651_ROSCH|nr:putative DOMON domain, cytochrome b561/ferric reductase transmembrane [Rosa chinensis]
MGNYSKYFIAMFYVFIKMMILLLEPKKNQMVNAADMNNTTVVVPHFCATDSTPLHEPYKDIRKFICSSLDWHGYSIAFWKDEHDVVTIVLSGMYEMNWIGVGVSRDGKMVGASAVVGWLRGKDSNSSVIKKYFLEGQSSDQFVPDKGDLEFGKAAPTMLLQDTTIYLAFQLQFANGITRQPFIFAAGIGKPGDNNILPKYAFNTSMTVDFSKGTFTLGYVDISKVKLSHGILAIVGWGIFIPLGVALARYLRDLEPLWYYLHSSVQFVGFFVGLAAVAVGKSLYDRIDADFLYHRAIGYTVLSLSVLEVCQFVMRPSSSSNVRYYWNLAHYWVGRITILLGPVNILIGLYCGNGGEKLKITYLCVLVFFVVAALLLEIRLLMKRKREAPTNLTKTPVFQVD